MKTISKATLFYNRKSGQAQNQPYDQTIQNHFKNLGISLDIIDLPLDAEKIDKIVDKNIEKGADIFIAAGGDGTISLVGNALIGKDHRLGILPLGTGNLLARELNIPLNIQKALRVITSEKSEVISVDTFELRNRFYVLNLSVGLTSEVMERTRSAEKQRMGIFAYLHHFIEQVLGLKLRKFAIEVDEKKKSYMASEILVTNGRLMGIEPFEWAEDVCVNDGKLDLFIIRAANIFDIIQFLVSVFTDQRNQSSVIKDLRFQHYCRIETKKPIQVQADGDPIGQTPVEIQVVPRALNVIIPEKVS